MEIGELLDGKYLIERILGKGGMGAVYLAENVQIGRKVAIKVLHADLAVDDQLVARFRMEARAAAAIGHPGIVDVLDMGRSDGAEFIVMERLEGETLAQRIRARGALPAEEAIPIVIEALDALAAAHDKGIIHRDLKPDNLFLVERPARVVKILDFGISKFQDAGDMLLTTTGAVMGTPLYMSPEQARGAKDVTHLADLYAMGAILYEALSGRPPFTGSTYNEVIANVLMEPHPSLATTLPRMSADLSGVVDALLAKSPADRPQQARVAKFQLEQVLRHDAPKADVPRPLAAASISPHAATTPQPDAPPAAAQHRRRRMMLWLGGGAALLLVGGVVASRISQSTTVTPVAAAPLPDLAPAATAVAALPPAIAPAPSPALAPPPPAAVSPERPTAHVPARPKPVRPPAASRPKPGLDIDHAFPGQ
jgi:serine/threonine-protein kinase